MRLMELSDQFKDKILRSMRKFIFESPDRLKIFVYLASRDVELEINDVSEGTNIDKNKLIDEFNKLVAKKLVNKRLSRDDFLGAFWVGHYSLEDNETTNILKEELINIDLKNYSSVYFDNQSEEDKRILTKLQNDLEAALYSFIFEEKLDLDNFIHQVMNALQVQKSVARDEFFSFIASNSLESRFVRFYNDGDKFLPNDLYELKGYIAHVSLVKFFRDSISESQEVNKNCVNVECVLKANGTMIPVVIHHEILKRFYPFYKDLEEDIERLNTKIGDLEKESGFQPSKNVSKIDKRLIRKGKIRRRSLKREILEEFKTALIGTLAGEKIVARGRMIRDTFVLYDFQHNASPNFYWDYEKRYFHNERSFPLQKALDKTNKKILLKFQEKIIDIEDRILEEILEEIIVNDN